MANGKRSYKFIMEMAAELEKFAPHFRADPRKMGGSLMRVFRDTRFSHDKTPYKTNIGIQFRHKLGKDVHAPGFYFHITPDESFLAVGCWRPESSTLGKIRDLIVEDPKKWFAARNNKKFVNTWELSGTSLIKSPRGYSADHIAIDDIKRKEFFAVVPLSRADILSPNLVKLVSHQFSDSIPLMRFLCKAIDIPY